MTGWVIRDVSVPIRSSEESDRILADEAGQPGMVVPRPRVAPTASRAGKIDADPDARGGGIGVEQRREGPREQQEGPEPP